MTKQKYIIIAVFGLLADQLIKFIALNTPFFDNGVFVFINANFAWSFPLSNAISLVLMIVVFVFLVLALKKWNAPSIWLILSGAVSNLIDRIFRGGVVDYIAIPWGGVINLADVMIFVGVILLIFKVGRNKNFN